MTKPRRRDIQYDQPPSATEVRLDLRRILRRLPLISRQYAVAENIANSTGLAVRMPERPRPPDEPLDPLDVRPAEGDPTGEIVIQLRKMQIRAQLAAAAKHVADAKGSLKAALTALDKVYKVGEADLGEPYKHHKDISHPDYQLQLRRQRERRSRGQE